MKRMINLLKRCRSAVEEVIWPSRSFCLLCECAVEGRTLCEACAEELELQRIRTPQSMPDVYSAYWHDGYARSLVHDLKFRCVADCAAALVPAMAETAAEMNLPEDVVLTWVPMPERRMDDRGIDHGRVLCEAFSAQTGLPARLLLKRNGEGGPPQHTLDHRKRLTALQGAFRAEGCEGMHVLLVDDVRTTGATADACRQALLNAGAKQVWAITATTPRRLYDTE